MTPIRRILFLAEGQLGDLLLLTPAIRAAKQSYPDAAISVLIVSRTLREMSMRDLSPSPTFRDSNVLSTNPHIDLLYLVSRPFLRSLKGVNRLRAEMSIVRFLRRKKFDTIISTFPEERFAIWAFMSGAIRRVGQKSQKFFRLYSILPDVNKRDLGVLEYYYALAKSVGAECSSKKTEYHVSAECKEWADNELLQHGIGKTDRFIALHAGASGLYRIWPPERYAALIDRLLGSTGLRVAICRSPVDAEICDAIVALMKTPALQVKDGGSVGNFAALLRRASLLISNDSGPRHLAIAVKTPSIALIRKFHDREWNVYGESHECVTLQGKEDCPSCPPGVCFDRVPEEERFGSYCIRMLTVDEVVSHVLSSPAIVSTVGNNQL